MCYYNILIRITNKKTLINFIKKYRKQLDHIRRKNYVVRRLMDAYFKRMNFVYCGYSVVNKEIIIMNYEIKVNWKSGDATYITCSEKPKCYSDACNIILKGVSTINDEEITYDTFIVHLQNTFGVHIKQVQS